MRKSSLRSWLRTEDGALGLGVYALLVGGLATALLSIDDRGGLEGLRARALLCFFLVACCLAAAIVIQALLRRPSLRVPLAVTGTATLSYAFADASFRGLFGRHLVHADFAFGLDAAQTRAFPISVASVGTVLALVVATVVASYFLLAMLAQLPGPRLASVGRRATAVFAGMYLLLFFRDLWWSGAGRWLDPAVGVHRPEQTEERVERTAKDGFRLGPSLENELFPTLMETARRARLVTSAEKTPDILFIHAESLRADHFRPELFAETFARTKDCFLSPRHYSTGNTTPNGLFGALTGLSPFYVEQARKHALFPLPLRALRELGYATHVWYPNQALDFDGLLGAVVGPDVEVHRTSGEERSEADAATVEQFAIRPRSTTPRFDYVVLDSSHYDYSYPSRYERFVPAGTLGIRFNPKTGEGLERADVSAARGSEEKVRNRYKNSLLYLDSLIARLLDVSAHAERPVAVVIFGDHGEALWDKGGPFGHSTQLSEAQTRVPALFCFPEAVTSRYRISSHADLFPTIFDWMGVRTDGAFMTGKSLLRYDPELDWAIARGPVTGKDASFRFLIVDADHRAEILQREPPIVNWVQDSEERELSPPPRDAVTHAFARFLQGALLRSPQPH